jgi:hypothetical protein
MAFMRLPRLLPLALVVAQVVAGVSVIATAAPSSAAISHYPTGVTGGTIAADGRLSNPELADCDVPQPVQQYVTFPSYAQTAAQICGMWALEDAAASAYDQIHGYADGTPSLTSGLYNQAGYVQTFLQEIAAAKSMGTTLTADQAAAYDWFLAVNRTFEKTVAADALREYRAWSTELCDYRPPNTDVFTYNPSSQPVCTPDKNPSLAALFTTVAPPTYANFVEYGRYDAEQELGVTEQAKDRTDQTLIAEGIVMGAGALLSIVGGGAPQLALQLGQGTSTLIEALENLNPSTSILKDLRIAQGTASRAQQALRQLSQFSEEYAVAAEEAEEVAERAGVAAEALAETEEEIAGAGAGAMSATFVIVTIAVTIAVTQGISVFTAANIPQQLAADIAAADPAQTNGYVANLLTVDNGAKATMVYANYRAQLQFPEQTIGVATSDGTQRSSAARSAHPAADAPTSAQCPDCVVYDEIPASADSVPSRIHVTALNADGTPSGWSTTTDAATFVDTWGMGSVNGAAGVPHVSVGIAGGKVWTEREASSAPTDDSEAGLTGWIPSDELHYFNAAGQPMIAHLQGDRFVTQTSPGSVDAGGYDAGDDCAIAGECTTGSSIVVMGSGGTPQLRDEITNGTFATIPCTANSPGTHDCLTDTLKANGKLVPANGSTVTTSDGEVIKQTGTSHLYRLTILPDTGTPASVWVTNGYNTWANDKTNGVAPNGGLVAGDTATFSASENSPAGYDTTYTWHVQRVCPVDPAHAAQSIQGVTVCSDSPDYGRSALATDEQDLTSCTATTGVCRPGNNLGVTWTADPAFHGGPVATLTGRSVDWTWPAPGTYHLRLITTDQYGVTRSSDRDLQVAAATAPRSELSYATAQDPQPTSVAPSVIGPVANGNALTVTGCVVSPTTRGATAYASPSVSVDWGDGASGSVATSYKSAASGCTTPWSWTATHTYAADTHGQPFVQVPITVTTADVTLPATSTADLPGSTKASSAITLYADVYAPTAPPSFVAGPSTTYDFTAGAARTVSGYVTSVPNATITQTPAAGVTQGGATCIAGLPSGVGFQASSDNHFVITGTPRVDAGGCYAITVTATNSHGSTDEHVVVAVAQAPRITSAAGAGWATTDAHDSLTVTTTGFPAPKLAVTGVDCTTGCGSALPADVHFVDNGDGTATLAAAGLSAADTGVYEVELAATSTSGTATQTLTLTVEGKPAFTSADSAGFTTGRAGTFVVGVSSTSAATVTCTIAGSNDHCMTGDGSRPLIDPDLANGTGLSLVGTTTAGTLKITGIPAAAGSYPVTLTATNTVGSTTQTLTILVSATGGATVTMVKEGNLASYTAGSIASGAAVFTLGQAGSVTLCSNLAGDKLSTESVVAGTSVATPLPAGLSIASVTRTSCPAGTEQLALAGTPTAPLTAGLTGATAYRIVDHAGGLALLTLRLLGDPTFSSPSTATFAAGESGSFTASLGTMRYNSTYFYGTIAKTSGSLPEGLTFTANADGTATISGTPTTGGATTVTLTGSNNGASVAQTLTISVTDAPAITSADSAGFRVGAGGSFTVRTSASSYPNPTLRVAGLPVGATFIDNGDGTGTLAVASDMPATAAPVVLAVSATSSAGSDTQQLRLAVGAAPVLTSPAGDATVVLERGEPASYTVTSSGAPTATLSASTLPAGLTFTDNGDGTATLGGTPTVLHETVVTVTAANGVGSAATSALDVIVTDPAAFAGTTTDSSCTTASAKTTHHRFVATASETWTLCGTGFPAPAVSLRSVTCGGEDTSLPAGLTFTESGDGPATISGAAAIGSGAACPGGYTVSVAIANAGGTVTKDLTLDVQEVIQLTTPSTAAPFVPGAPNTLVLGAAGSPTPAFALDAASSLPSWLTVTDLGNGTAGVTGTPPASAAGTSVSFRIDVTNADAEPLVEEITIPVSDIGLTAATPPAASLGTPYGYRFEGSTGTTFALADGSALPTGLTLSADGLLSGTPTELGRFPIALSLTRAGDTVTTGTLNLQVGVGEHALEVSQFRTLAPGEWFVQVVNTTEAAIPLAGWHVGLQQPGATDPELITLGTGTLAPGGTAVVTTTGSNVRSQLSVTSLGTPQVAVESGFEVVAPNGAVVDAAGVSGALPELVKGTGVAYPASLTTAQLGYAFVRRGFADGHPVDTDDNAADFVFTRPVGIADTTTSPPSTTAPSGAAPSLAKVHKPKPLHHRRVFRLSAAGIVLPAGVRITGYTWALRTTKHGRVHLRTLGHGTKVRFRPAKPHHVYRITLTVTASNGTSASRTFKVVRSPRT